MNVSPVRKSVWAYLLRCPGVLLFMLLPGLDYANIYYQDYVASEKSKLEAFEDSLIFWTHMGDLLLENASTPVQRNFLMCGSPLIDSVSPYLEGAGNWTMQEIFLNDFSFFHFSGTEASKCRSFEINYTPSGDTGLFSAGIGFQGLPEGQDFRQTLSINAFPSTDSTRLKEVGQLFVGKEWDYVALYQNKSELKITLFRHRPMARNRSIYLNTDNWMITSVREPRFLGVTSAEAICHTRDTNYYLYIPPYASAGMMKYEDEAPRKSHQRFKAFDFCRRERRNGRIFLWHALQGRNHEPSSGFLAVKSRTTEREENDLTLFCPGGNTTVIPEKVVNLICSQLGLGKKGRMVLEAMPEAYSNRLEIDCPDDAETIDDCVIVKPSIKNEYWNGTISEKTAGLPWSEISSRERTTQYLGHSPVCDKGLVYIHCDKEVPVFQPGRMGCPHSDVLSALSCGSRLLTGLYNNAITHQEQWPLDKDITITYSTLLGDDTLVAGNEDQLALFSKQGRNYVLSSQKKLRDKNNLIAPHPDQRRVFLMQTRLGIPKLFNVSVDESRRYFLGLFHYYKNVLVKKPSQLITTSGGYIGVFSKSKGVLQLFWSDQ
ncbi:MAG: hypothetical protein ACR2PT_14150 [Endozoicomonas sp.]